MKGLLVFFVKVSFLILIGFAIGFAFMYSEAEADDKFLFIFGGFPDIRHLGGGMISPHGTANPAALELDTKYDINISIGFASSEPSKQTYIRVSDSVTSRFSGAFGFKCASEEFICARNNSKILEGDLSYKISISSAIVGLGIGAKAKLDNQFQDIFGQKNVFLGPGIILATKINKEINFSTGASIFLNFQDMKKIYGGLGFGVLTYDIFASTQFFITEKIILSGGLTVRALEWFRISLGYSQGVIAGAGFVSPRFYIWGGYSFRKIGMVSFGLVL